MLQPPFYLPSKLRMFWVNHLHPSHRLLSRLKNHSMVSLTIPLFLLVIKNSETAPLTQAEPAMNVINYVWIETSISLSLQPKQCFSVSIEQKLAKLLGWIRFALLDHAPLFPLQGVVFCVFIHESRALTELKESKADASVTADTCGMLLEKNGAESGEIFA